MFLILNSSIQFSFKLLLSYYLHFAVINVSYMSAAGSLDFIPTSSLLLSSTQISAHAIEVWHSYRRITIYIYIYIIIYIYIYIYI